MIHIATVHWETDMWIDIQLKYLSKNINQPFRLYAFLSGDAVKHSSKFYYSSAEPIREHAIKLNLLSEIISLSAESENDILIFIDGDAFPVTSINSLLSELQHFPLLAIQRLENVGDIQPHPSFCITSVGFWKSIHGDWKEGHEWLTYQGTPRTDVGGNLLKILDDQKIKWKPMHRTSQLTDHPVMFGVYDNIIYHHGAGFRVPMSRYDRLKPLSGLCRIKILGEMLDFMLKKQSLRNRFRIHRLLGINKLLENQNRDLSNKVYNSIKSDDFFKQQ